MGRTERTCSSVEYDLKSQSGVPPGSYAMPCNTNILLIRHAEVPDGKGAQLSVSGEARAQAYTSYFKHLVIGKRKISSHGNGSLSVPTDRARARIELLVADTLRLPFDDGMFDVVSVAFGIRNVSDFEAGIREMTRVAKPGGRVVILEFSMPGNRFFGRMYTMYFTRMLPAIGRVVSRSGNDAYSYLPDSVMEFPSGSEMCGVMERCGLANVSAMELSLGIVSLYVGHKPDTGSKNGG